MSEHPHWNQAEAHSDHLEQRIAHANEAANSAVQIRDFVTARCIKLLSTNGHSQGEIADQLGMNETLVEHLLSAPITYTPNSGSAATMCDAIEEAAWETPAAMREGYIALTASHTTCPRCGDTSTAQTMNFCPQCRFPYGDVYRPPATDTERAHPISASPRATCQHGVN